MTTKINKGRQIALSFIILSFSLALSSCSKWLELYPEDEIIEDEFWNTASDVDMMVSGAYRYMLETGVLQRFVYLGEMRSDNLQTGNPNSNERAVVNEGNLLSENSICDWSTFYKVINICNNVIAKAGDVREKDLNFGEAEYQHAQSEAMFLRALCYFYLVRGWGDVPYVTEPSSSDATDYNRPQTNADEIINMLISDMQTAKLYATPSWGTQAKNCGRVTRNACRALLADLYLWAGRYGECVRECDEVLAGYVHLAGTEQTEWQLLPRSTFFNRVFYAGNSVESIFEFNLNSSNSANLTVFTQLYGNATTNPHLVPTASLLTTYDDADARGMQFVDLNNNHIFKYVGQVAPVADTQNEAKNSTYTYRATSSAPHWIVYRLADIYLMKAEALAVGGTTAADFDQVVTLCNKTYIRSHPEGADSLDHALYTDRNSAYTLVMEERRRELAFEGKRWFDLLRQVRREGGPTESIVNNLVANKYSGTAPDGITGKLSSIGYWYWPIYKTEIDVNKNLHQNEYYQSQESEQ
ncbi:MAG: RagB/SusD family nutrient uptake outer membrane protein [Prevotella sp.]|nr:RagB/SusD family nutrient uptake outer membrane protein [Prevotella sp.]